MGAMQFYLLGGRNVPVKANVQGRPGTSCLGLGMDNFNGKPRGTSSVLCSKTMQDAFYSQSFGWTLTLPSCDEFQFALLFAIEPKSWASFLLFLMLLSCWKPVLEGCVDPPCIGCCVPVTRGEFNSFSKWGFNFISSQSLSKGVPSCRNGKYAAIEETIYIPCQRLKEHKNIKNHKTANTGFAEHTKLLYL